MRVSIEAQTDVGRVRELNEDSYQLLPEHNAVIVCDGMGGHAAGEVASTTAAQTIADLLLEPSEDLAGLLAPLLARPLPGGGANLAAAVRVANRRLFNAAARSNKLRGMGTTVVAACFSEGLVITAHVGDSRAYRISGDRIEQLTTDHSWIAELVQAGQVSPEDAENFADKNVITRALGTRAQVQVDVGAHSARAGEIYLLCSDGLCGYVSDGDILAIVQQHSGALAQAAQELIAAANQAGGIDNTTVAIVRVESVAQSQESYEPWTHTLPEESGTELDLIDEIIKKRYPGEEVSGVAAAVAVGEADTDAGEDAVPTGAVEAGSATAGERKRALWGWWVFIILILALIATFLWPRRAGGPDSDGEADANFTRAGAQPVSAGTGEAAGTRNPTTLPAVPQPGEALIFLRARGEQRQSRVYWDGVYQGRISELERGLLVDPGAHELAVMSDAGETTFVRSLTMAPDDTMDIEVK